MKTFCKPVHRDGFRNALCPNYRKCLDLAIRRSWAYWDCAECEYRSARDPEFDMQITMNKSVTYYDLPMGVSLKM
jgi:hypothetical protein